MAINFTTKKLPISGRQIPSQMLTLSWPDKSERRATRCPVGLLSAQFSGKAAYQDGGGRDVRTMWLGGRLGGRVGGILRLAGRGGVILWQGGRVGGTLRLGGRGAGILWLEGRVWGTLRIGGIVGGTLRIEREAGECCGWEGA